MKLRLLILAIVCLPVAHGQTINAASCNQPDVLAALNSVTADGTTVVLPSCPSGVTWNTTLNYTATHSITIKGAGNQAVTGGGDATVISDNMSSASVAMWAITIASGKSLRFTGITIQAGTRTIADNGSLQIFCNNTIGEFRMDHSHLKNIRGGTAMKTQDCFGVLDHNDLDESGTGNNAANYLHVWNPSYNGGINGNGSWSAADDYGTAKFLYLEDNNIETGTDDCTFAGRVVVRFNNVTHGGNFQTHPTGGGGPNERGCRAYEIYENNMADDSNLTPEFNAIWMSSGPALIWGNPTLNYTNFLTIHSMRRDNSTYSELPTPNGWGYCGTSFNGTGSAWDGNTTVSTGYPCLDQPGRGKGDLITGVAPNQINSVSGIISWPRQALSPLYEWLDTKNCSGCGGSFIANYGSLFTNQDYYTSQGASCSGASCSTGVGSGTLANRPANCTVSTSPDGATSGVAYWATDQGSWNNSSGNNVLSYSGQGQLYVCTATNTWTLYYTPFQYPHPLAAGSLQPAITFSPQPLAFGNVPVGLTSNFLTLTITNSGAASLTISSLNSPGAFPFETGGTCSSTPITIAPGASCTVMVAFTPGSIGSFSQTNTTTDNTSTSPSPISVTGTGTGSPALVPSFARNERPVVVETK